MLKRKKVKSLSRVQLFANSWVVAHQAPPSMGFFQARVLEWIAISFSRGSSHPKDWTRVSPDCKQTLYRLSHQGSILAHLIKCSVSLPGRWDDTITCTVSYRFWDEQVKMDRKIFFPKVLSTKDGELYLRQVIFRTQQHCENDKQLFGRKRL